MLEQHSIIAWLQGMKTETGLPVDLRSHYWQFDIFLDMSQTLAAQKPAQVGFTTMQALKMPFYMNKMGLDGIYSLPTASDANDLSKAKFKRLIDNNERMKELVADMDTIHQKKIGKNHVLYILGTFSQKSAMMHSADWYSCDELDASDPAVVEQMSTRLQHSPYKIEHYFSHPSVPGHGVNKFFEISDQKHWFVKCSWCGDRQLLEWKDDGAGSIEFEIDETLPVKDENRVKHAQFVCKACRKPLSDDVRRTGEWVKKHLQRSVSGYQISLLMSPIISAKQIVQYWDEKSADYFHNKVLGLPYVGQGNIITADIFFANLTGKRRGHVSETHGRPIMGLDTGLTQYFVIGDNFGIFHYGKCGDYGEIYRLMDYFPDMVVVVDALGELLETRKLKQKYPGRVFMNYYDSDKKSDDVISWGEGERFGEVRTDRNKITQTVVDEFRDKRIKLWGTEKDYYDMYLHVKNMYRQETRRDDKGVTVRNWVFVKPDHWNHALNYFRVGFSRFGGMKPQIITSQPKSKRGPLDNMSVDIQGKIQTPDLAALWEKAQMKKRRR